MGDLFERVEGNMVAVEKTEFAKREAALRAALLAVQYKIIEAKAFPVLVVIGGVDGAGKGETVNALTEWMDPRHIHAHALGPPTDEERMRPPMWRYWRRLPPRGKMGVFFGSWYTQPILEYVMGDASRKALNLALVEIQRFETMLVRDGAVIQKFWFHMSRKAQKERLKELESDKRTRWRVTDEDHARLRLTDEFRAASAHAIEQTSSPDSPWTLVDGRDERARLLFVGETLLAALTGRLAQYEAAKQQKAASAAAGGEPAEPPRSTEPAEPAEAPAAKPAKRARGKTQRAGAAAAKDREKDKQKPAHGTLLSKVDLSKKLEKDAYEHELDKWQRKLALLTRHRDFARLSPVLVFEGADAAGKGGTIRRVTQALDARLYNVVPVAAPSDEERAQSYLWRFWRQAPSDGRFVIFDRSWYGRVLVERVEGFCAPPDWERAFGEITDFEQQLVRAGCPIAKFWLQISPEEQLRRFHEREKIQWKQFKITPEDWRNRAKWGDYQLAASEMIERTSSPAARWTVVEAEDKHWARIKVLRTVCESIADAL